MQPLSPRDIQTRVRAGESPESLADHHDVPLEKVMRFAETVLLERVRVTGEARRARTRLNGEGAFVDFGEAVDARFATYGVDPLAVRWDSRRRDDGQWIISASWVVGLDSEEDPSAEWLLTLATRTVSPLDDTAADLLSDRPITPVAAEEVTEALPADIEDEPARPVVATARPATLGVLSFPAMPDAMTGPLPGISEQVFDQTLFEDEAPAEDEAPVEEVRSEPAAKVTNLGLARRSAPDTDDAESNPYVETNDERAERARIPSWDDILLGVRRKSDG